MSDPYAAFGAPVDPYAQYGAPAQAPAAQPTNPLWDMARAVPGGLAQGASALLGMPEDLRELANKGLDKGSEYLAGLISPSAAATMKAVNAKAAQTRLPVGSADIAKAVSAPTGGFYKPQTDAGRYAQSVASFAPAAVGGPGGVLPKIVSTVAGGIGSQGGQDLFKGTPLEVPASIAGGLLGGSLGGLNINPRGVLGDVSPETAQLAQDAQKLGITVRPGQAAGRPFTKVADSTLERLPGTGYGTPTVPTNTQQAGQFTRAVSKTFGENSHVLDQATMSAAKSRIGNVFDTVIPRNQIALDQPLVDNLNDISSRAMDNLLPGAPRDQVNGTLAKIKDKMAQGIDPNTPMLGTGNPYRLTGPQYQAMRARGGVIDNIAKSSDPTVAHYGMQIRTALDDAFERQAPAADSALLQQARQQYKNMKTVEPLAAQAPTGEISPASLANFVRKSYPNSAYNGAGDLGTLGKIGQRFLKDPPNSGTAERSYTLQLVDKPVKAIGATLAIPQRALAGRLMNKYINSQPIMPNLGAPPLLKMNPYSGLIGGAFALSPAIVGSRQ